MTHRIDVRLPDKLYMDLRKQPGKMTHNVCTALTQMLYNTKTCADNQYSFEYIEHMQEEIKQLWVVVHELMTEKAINPRIDKKISVLSNSHETDNRNQARVDYNRLGIHHSTPQKKTPQKPLKSIVGQSNKYRVNHTKVKKKQVETKKKGFWARIFG